ncbi:MAG: photosynthetic complex putative assembly protein PuhB [Pseudomonadota bacterium]
MSEPINDVYATDSEFEPVPGLPEELPEGEHILWQGAPTFRNVAIHQLHLRKLAVYFVLILGLRHLWLASSGHGLMTDLAGTMGLLVAANIALGILLLISYFIARTTLYTITNRRVVMRIGIALPMPLNLPFSALSGADLRLHRDGSGDILLQVADRKRLSYVVLWPHLKMRGLLNVQPALRSLNAPQEAATTLAAAIAETPNALPSSEIDASPVVA